MKQIAFTLLLSFSCIAIGDGQQPGGVTTSNLEPLDSDRNREVPVKIYLKSSPGPQPVILFSHGLGGSRDASPYLGQHWAEHGYIAVFVQHKGSDKSIWKGDRPGQRLMALKQAISLENASARPADISFVIDQLEIWHRDADHFLYGKLDLEHIGIAGHSYGANTTQTLMGQVSRLMNPSVDPRIDAFLPMSPSAPQVMSPEKAFGKIAAPVLCMTGTRDGNPVQRSMTPESRQLVYQGMPDGNKFQLVLKDAEHHAFAGSGRESRFHIPHHHPAISELSTLFWDAYLKGNQDAKAKLQSDQTRELAGLMEEDVWEWK
jgi:dienelactone hydrolase